MESKAQFLKGCARTLVLQLLAERPMYGYELASQLSRRSEGIFALGQGTLYPLLYSLESKGQIRVTREEPSDDGARIRRYYALTHKGRAELEASVDTWNQIARGMRLVLETTHA
jgi:PadR family transcriptional regulator, regulatory protein PadR